VGDLKRLIVNADDFGRSPGVNRGIAEAHRGGIVTSATLMVTGNAAEDAVSLAKEMPTLGLGLHVTLTGSRSILPQREIPSLVDAKGNLPQRRSSLDAARPEHVLAETRAQLQAFRRLVGAMPTHLDSHRHAHVYPAVLEAFLTLSWETGLPVRSATDVMRDRLRLERVPTTDYFIEEFYGDKASAASLARILGDLPMGLTELMCHPGRVDDVLRGASGYAEPRARELALLTDREARQLVQAGGIKLVHFGALSS